MTTKLTADAEIPRRAKLPAEEGGTITAALNGSLFGNLPWGVLLIAAGIGIYFSFPAEPTAPLVALGILAILLLWVTTTRRPLLHPVITALLITTIGFGAALYRTHSVGTPLLQPGLKFYIVKMRITEAIPLAHNRIRYIGDVQSLSRVPSARLPKRIRLRATDQGPRFEYGDLICGRAMLDRPKGPLRPGGYDFGRALWFDRIGGTGFAISSLRHCNAQPQQTAPPATTMASLIASLRRTIADRLDSALEEPHRALARALILGDRGRIADEDLKALREAGLGHLLAISGLHMAVFAGTVFFLVRAGLAISPTLAQQYPIKKWAALAALAGGSVYFLISGQSIPTQRAFLMIGIVFLAILTERPALTLRNVGIAAMVILLFRPESLLSPGFQMSFAAVTALIVFYQLTLTARPLQQISDFTRQVTWLRPLYYLFGICLTSLIATAATAPFAIYHFHQLSYMGPVGNMLAIPIFSVLLMPSAVSTLALMPLGLEGLALAPLSLAIDLLLASAHWTASFDPAVIKTGVITATSVILMTLAAMLIIFVLGRLRWAGVPLLVAAIFTAPPPRKPDIYINRDGSLVAIRAQDGRLYAPDGRKATFALTNWLRADGDSRSASDSRDSLFFRCDDEACSGTTGDQTAPAPQRKKVSLVRTMGALAEECRTADIVIYNRSITRPCKNAAMVLSRQELTLGGATTIYIDKQGKITIRKANAHRRKRIWSGR